MNTKVSIVVPAHNEEKNLGILVPKLAEAMKQAGLGYEIIVVNDNSSDGTGAVCTGLEKEYGIRTLARDSNPGMGNALKDGTAAAKGDFVVWVMADLSDDPFVIAEFVKKLEAGADVVFGSRYMKGGTSGNLQASKRLSSWGFSLLSRLVIGVPVHDITNAFRGFQKQVFMGLDIKSGDFGISPEFALKAHINGFRLDEVPASYRLREHGIATFRICSMGTRYLGILFEAVFLKLRK